ncbi:MAG: hypothetical protein ACI9H6_000280 [Patiriisocius sp.]|jgi:hypothetical protein
MLRTHSETDERIMWGWTVLHWSWWAARGLLALYVIAVSMIVSLGVLFVGFLLLEETFRFSQPRDALSHAPQYVQVHEDAETYCVTRCSQEQLDMFLKAREVALSKEWPDLLEVMTQRWRWKKHTFVEFSMGHQIRDDFYILIDQVGGASAAADCLPLVEWTAGSSNIQEAFLGFVCDGGEFRLKF